MQPVSHINMQRKIEDLVQWFDAQSWQGEMINLHAVDHRGCVLFVFGCISLCSHLVTGSTARPLHTERPNGGRRRNVNHGSIQLYVCSLCDRVEDNLYKPLVYNLICVSDHIRYIYKAICDTSLLLTVLFPDGYSLSNCH